ncbi:MAG: hypothetical protein AAFO07_31555, partial [Bacteroidota bacterium]
IAFIKTQPKRPRALKFLKMSDELKKKEIWDELAEKSSFLHEIKKQSSPFKVPDGYFNQLPDQIMNQIKAERKEAPVQPNWLEQLIQQLQVVLQPRPALALASMLLIVLVAWLVIDRPNATESSVDFASLSQDEIESYIYSNIDQFNEVIIEEVANNDEELQLIPSPQIQEDELNDYIQDELEDLDIGEIEELF